jgi:ligand-binding sensor domain-containing protein
LIGLIVFSVTILILVETHISLVDIVGQVISLTERGLWRIGGLPELPAFKDAAELAVCVEGR